MSSYTAQHRRLACEEDVMDTMTLPAIPVIPDEIPATAAKPAHRRPQDRGLLHRFLVFGSVGAFVFVVGTALQWVLLKPLGADYSYIWQTIFSVELSYVLNRWLTWHDRDVSVISSLVKWNAQKLVLTVPNIVCYDLLLWAGMNWLVSNLAATAAFTVMNYVAADKWTFIRQYRRVNEYGEATGCITGPLQPGNRVQFRRVMSRGQQVILGLFLTVMVVSGGGLLVLLAATAHVTSIVTGSVLVLMLGVEALRISVGIPVALFACRARDPIPLLPNGQLPRVALLTTVVPGKEPIEMVRHTLLAMLAVRYPGVKDVWLLDEGNHPDFRALCEELGVRHFSRKGIAELNQEGEAHTPYRAKTKAGNHNAWRSRYENEYDLVGQSDPDHVPKPWFLERTVGYFNDPDVGFVVAPQIYGNSDKNWIARGAAQAAYIFEAIVQRGANGLGAPILIGTNHMYRTECWRQIGGYQDSLIEDHVTALAVFAQTNPATVNRWRGVYSPDILSVGEGPATFTDWFNQQMRWSFGMWNVVAEWSPKFLLKLRWKQTVSFLLLQPYYLIAAFQWMLSIALITVYMVTGTDLGIPMEWWAVLWGTSMFSGLVFFFWTARFRLTADQRRETGLTGIALMLMTLPIYAASGVRWLMGCGLPYVITAKGDMQSPDSMRTFQPHLVVLTLTVYLLVLSAGGMIHGWPVVLFWAWFATAVCAVPIIVHLVGKVGRCLKRLA